MDLVAGATNLLEVVGAVVVSQVVERPSGSGSNPGMDLAFFGNAINLFSLGVGYL